MAFDWNRLEISFRQRTILSTREEKGREFRVSRITKISPSDFQSTIRFSDWNEGGRKAEILLLAGYGVGEKWRVGRRKAFELKATFLDGHDGSTRGWSKDLAFFFIEKRTRGSKNSEI